jgi:hypothetical protein
MTEAPQAMHPLAKIETVGTRIGWEDLIPLLGQVDPGSICFVHGYK